MKAGELRRARMILQLAPGHSIEPLMSSKFGAGFGRFGRPPSSGAGRLHHLRQLERA